MKGNRGVQKNLISVMSFLGGLNFWDDAPLRCNVERSERRERSRKHLGQLRVNQAATGLRSPRSTRC
jgi:hypothetical protein